MTSNFGSAPGNKMNLARKCAVWFFMLAKRLFKKPVFIITLILIPLLGGMMSLAAKEESGIKTIILVAEGGADEVSHRVVDALMNEESVVNFKEYPDADGAIEQVEFGKADAAWIIPAGLGEEFVKYANDISYDLTAANIYQREDDSIIRLVREKLNGALFRELSKEIYETFRDDVSEVGLYPDKEEFMQYYKDFAFKESIVKFEFLVASEEQATVETDYLTSPVRGIAALASLICVLAASLYSMQDEKNGFYSRVPASKRLPLFFASNLASSIASSVAMVLALILSGTFTSASYEIPAAAIFALATASFCTLMCRVFGSPFALGAAIPPILLACAALCPVFVSLVIPFHPDLLFPVTYALKAVLSYAYVGYGAIYSAAAIILAYAVDAVRRLRS
ncbi:MAG: ABC transporter permease [Clostridia bacterium]|nr:ABC transporter permease [Clostridia bacterium]